MSMEIKLSFLANVGRKRRSTAGNRKTAQMSIRKVAMRERREGKMFLPRDICILAVMVKARGNIVECNHSFILADR